MRKHIACFLAAFLLLSLCGCQEKSACISPVNFYYQAAEFSYDAAGTAISPEVREGKDHTSLDDALREYLQGPESASLKSPFPGGLQLLAAEIDGVTLHLTLSDQLSQLSGLALTMACSCLALTALELAQAEQVTIQAESKLLDGEKIITMDRDSLALVDSAQQTRDQ